MRFDILPIDNNVVINIARMKLSVLLPGEDEMVGDRQATQADLLEQVENDKEQQQKDKSSPMVKCQRQFAALSKDDILSAKSFCMTYGAAPAESFSWDILRDDEHHIHSTFVPPASSNVVSEFFDFNKAKEDNFFEHVFPSILGHSKIIDKFMSDNRATYYYETARLDKIKFHDPLDPDPDWKVQQCYLLLIAAATELEAGFENLWKKGMKGRRCLYPNFGRFVGINEMRIFCSAAPYCWADQSLWYKPQKRHPMGNFLPLISDFNDKRRLLIKTMLLMLDESMSGWRPKTSKLGGLPNYTFEPRKQIPLGTMF